MTAYPIPNPFSQWVGITGLPLTGAKIYIGEPSQDPETHPIAVYQDAGLTIPLAQPIRTNGGYLSGSGTPVNVYPASAPYSIRVRTSANVEVFYQAAVHDEIGEALATLLGTLTGAANTILFDQSATYAAGTIGKHDQNFVCVTDAPFNAVADGVWSGTVASGTDNYTAFTAALAFCATKGKRLYIPAGVYRLSAGLSLPAGVEMFGDGYVGLGAFLDGARESTILLVNTGSAADSIKYAENSHGGSVQSMSIFNTASTMRSVLNVTGVLYPCARDLEIGSLVIASGDGMLLAPSTGGAAFETLYGAFYNVMCAQGSTAAVKRGIVVKGLTSSPSARPNDNNFFGGKFAGWQRSFEVAGDLAGSGPKGVTFHGVTFEETYTTVTGTPQMEIAYVDNGAKVAGYGTTDPVYVVKMGVISDGTQIALLGCWFGCGSLPANYNDGTNGTWPILAAVWLDNKTYVKAIEIIGPTWDGVYVYDNASFTTVSLTTDFKDYSGAPKAILKLSSTATTSITGSMAKVPFTVQSGDTAITWDVASSTGTIRSDGNYLVTAEIGIAGVAAADNVNAQIRLVMGGFTEDGTTDGATGVTMTPAATCVVPMYQGDQFYLMAMQTSGSNKNLSGDAKQNRLTVAKL